ncbi:MAG: hypothetical protein AB8G16_15255 [Gammaproteobacteria bacterium]
MVITIICTALLSALITVAAAAFYINSVLIPRLQTTFAHESDALTAAIEARVKAGVEAGIASGIDQAASAETLVRATRTATRSGASLVEDGLNVLLGSPRKRSDD